MLSHTFEFVAADREMTLEPIEQINNGMSLTSLAARSAAESMFSMSETPGSERRNHLRKPIT